MAPPIQIALVVLVALLVGALIPLLWSAFALVRQARETLRLLEKRADEIGEKTTEVLGRADRIAGGVEQELPALHRTADRLDRLGEQVEQLTETVRKIQAVSATLGPAVAAGIQAYRAVVAARAAQPASPDGEPDLPEAVSDAILEQLKAEARDGQSD